MQITFNGQPIALATDTPTLADVLQAQGLGARRVAVEVNGDVVPRSLHASTALHEGDRVEVVHALGGG